MIGDAQQILHLSQRPAAFAAPYYGSQCADAMADALLILVQLANLRVHRRTLIMQRPVDAIQ